jgi:2-amino-4-hydroxy-6-hydroxymethyldihydropteridine diphosphokinase
MLDVAYIALGSNLGDRHAHLARARDAIAALPETIVIAESSIEETEPLGGLRQEPYLNQMIAAQTTLPPRELLSRLHEIEAAGGRVCGERWASRTIDLDIVRFDRQTVSDADFQVPHRELPNRAFWQRELAELRGEG